MLPDKEEWKSLNEKFDKADPSDRIGSAMRDLCGLGCYLHFIGFPTAGRKSIDAAMKAVSFDKTDRIIFKKITGNLTGNEKAYSDNI